MAIRLYNMVVCGEIINNSKNSVRGFLQIRDSDKPIIFDLTGNCDADLAGKHIRFEAPKYVGNDLSTKTDLSSVSRRQIGPTGKISAALSVRDPGGPIEEIYMRCKMGEPPPEVWKRCLYLEWYGQNGRVVLELLDPKIEVLENNIWVRDTGSQIAPVDVTDDSGPGITAIRIDDAGYVSSDSGSALDFLAESEESHASDPYGLLPTNLQDDLDARARDIDQRLSRDPELARHIRDLELMDDLIERGDGVPLGDLLEPPHPLRSPSEIGENEAEFALKTLLGRLALLGISFDMCEHYSWLEAYRLLIERVSVDARCYPELKETQWVQHYTTHEYCQQCEAAILAEIEEQQESDSSSEPEEE